MDSEEAKRRHAHNRAMAAKYPPLTNGITGPISGPRIQPWKGAPFRGLVIAPPVSSVSDAVDLLDMTDFRAALFLWDRIDMPHADMMNLAVPEFQYLIERGNLQQSECQFRGEVTSMAGLFREVQLRTFKALDEAQPGMWSLSRGKNTASSFEMDTEGRGVSVNLTNAIVVPDVEVPFEEILHFKEVRKPELLRLRGALDDLYQKVLSASDFEYAQASALREVDQAVTEQLRVAKESGLRFRFANIEARLDYTALAGGFTAWAAATKAGLPQAAAFISGAGSTAALAFSYGFGRKDASNSRKPFEYVMQMHDRFS